MHIMSVEHYALSVIKTSSVAANNIFKGEKENSVISTYL